MHEHSKHSRLSYFVGIYLKEAFRRQSIKKVYEFFFFLIFFWDGSA